jgi:hypothetical protein
MQFLGFSTYEKGALRQEISKWSMVFSMFLRSGWSIVKSALLAKEVLQKKDHHCTCTKFWLRVIRWVTLTLLLCV